MFPSSSYSSSQNSISQSGLTRYGSAPGSLLTTAVDAVIGPDRDFSADVGSRSSPGQHYFSGDSSSLASESTRKVNSFSDPKDPKGLHKSYVLHDAAIGDFGTPPSNMKDFIGGGSCGSSPSSSSALVRQRSSPAGFVSYLATPADNDGGEKRELGIILALKLDIYPSISLSSKHIIKAFIVVAILVLELVLILSASEVGFSISRGSGSYNFQGVSNGGHGASSLKSQLSFTGQDSLSQISEGENIVDGISSDNGHHRPTHSYATTCFGMDNWDNSHSIVFSAPPSKRSKANIDGDILNCLSALESQFSLPQTSLEMATMEKLLHIPEDSVACKIRARRGCATHPRSIAERERRTRISGKLKKLQDLVPNMDKQTSYADMLDFAVQHIKGLQSQVKKLHRDLENCTCGCKEST